MWFRPRIQTNENDRLPVTKIRNRSRSKKSMSKCADADSGESNIVIANSVTALPSHYNARRTSFSNHEEDDAAKEKIKVLRSNQKYKTNRVTKSSSRNKISDLKVDKQTSSKTANDNCSNYHRKVSTPHIAYPIETKTTRKNTSLNLNAFLRYKSFIGGSTKKLTSDDFDRLRRKSLGDSTKVRRKSNPDEKIDSSIDLRLSNSNSCESNNNSSENDFHSCNEYENDDLRTEPILKHFDNGNKTQCKTAKFTPLNTKTGFYCIKPETQDGSHNFEQRKFQKILT